MPNIRCWICSQKANSLFSNSITYFDCERCGKYKVEWPLSEDNKLEDFRQIANVSGWVRENQDEIINDAVFKRLQNLKTPSVNERADKLLRWFDSQTEYLGHELPVYTLDKSLWARSWTMNVEETEYLILYLIERSFLKSKGLMRTISFYIHISTNGFSHLDESSKLQSNIGFCAMSFAEELLPVWNEAISPAITKAGYDPVRIDTELYNTGIVDQIKAKIRQAKFIVADLTMHRQGVYWEAGFADGLGRDVIYTCREDEFEKKHFDVQHLNIIKWKPEQHDVFKGMLTYRITGTIGEGSK